MITPNRRESLLSSQARIQAPWIKLKIGDYTFGVYNKSEENKQDENGFYLEFKQTYPNYIQSINIKKINGQVNIYTISIVYPVRVGDDPNFFEKVFSSVANTRKIIISYGDSATPAYCYKDEEAIITDISTQFNFQGSSISYTVKAVSGAALAGAGCFSFPSPGSRKPSDIIKDIFNNPTYKLRDLFTGMSNKNLDALVDGSDAEVKIETKTNISALEYISYLVSCMIPAGDTQTDISKDIYVLTMHDDTIYDEMYNDSTSIGGPYFQVKRTSYAHSYSDAFEIDIGYNTSTIVTSFNIDKNENYSILYDYSKDLQRDEYVRRINSKGMWEDVFAPAFTSKNVRYETRAEDISWYTKLTKFPIKATITIQGLLRPAMLMQYVRLNIIFPGGRKHIGSGLYIVTQEIDNISTSGYRTTLSLTRIEGDDHPTEDEDWLYQDNT